MSRLIPENNHESFRWSGFEGLGWVFTVTKLVLPITWGVSLLRSTMAGNATIASLWQSGELVGFITHAVAYLALGLAVFAWGNRAARRRGTLAHY